MTGIETRGIITQTKTVSKSGQRLLDVIDVKHPFRHGRV